eukprot:2644342-Prymnesium_polylepis.1
MVVWWLGHSWDRSVPLSYRITRWSLFHICGCARSRQPHGCASARVHKMPTVSSFSRQLQRVVSTNAPPRSVTLCLDAREAERPRLTVSLLD